MMFQPVFVFDGKGLPNRADTARDKGFRMVDIQEAGVSVHGENTAVIVYDISASRKKIDRLGEPRAFLPPKKAGVIIFHTYLKGYVRNLADPVQAIEWFTGERVEWYNRITGNFKLEQIRIL